MIKACVLADSITNHPYQITTLEVTMPRFILAQFNTHRAFSRNAASSRAIPTTKLIEQVKVNPVIPMEWGKNQKGMSATEVLPPAVIDRCEKEWLLARDRAVEQADCMLALGVHKQLANRLLEPFLWVKVLVTSTDWSNFFGLRLHHDAQPEMQAVAAAIFHARCKSTPTPLQFMEWHIPFGDKMPEGACLSDKLRIATARCARLSYNTHDGDFSPEKDFALFEQLFISRHMSPFEHCAFAWHGKMANFDSWCSYRYLIEHGLTSIINNSKD